VLYSVENAEFLAQGEIKVALSLTEIICASDVFVHIICLASHYLSSDHVQRMMDLQWFKDSISFAIKRDNPLLPSCIDVPWAPTTLSLVCGLSLLNKFSPLLTGNSPQALHLQRD